MLVMNPYILPTPALQCVRRSGKGCPILNTSLSACVYAKQGQESNVMNPDLAMLSSTCFVTTPTFASCKRLHKRLRPSGSTANRNSLGHHGVYLGTSAPRLQNPASVLKLPALRDRIFWPDLLLNQFPVVPSPPRAIATRPMSNMLSWRALSAGRRVASHGIRSG